MPDERADLTRMTEIQTLSTSFEADEKHFIQINFNSEEEYIKICLVSFLTLYNLVFR